MTHYNDVRPYRAVGYIAPSNFLVGRVISRHHRTVAGLNPHVQYSGGDRVLRWHEAGHVRMVPIKEVLLDGAESLRFTTGHDGAETDTFLYIRFLLTQALPGALSVRSSLRLLLLATFILPSLPAVRQSTGAPHQREHIGRFLDSFRRQQTRRQRSTTARHARSTAGHPSPRHRLLHRSWR